MITIIVLGAFIAEILPHDKVSRALGPESGLKGLLIGTAFGAILPGGPFTAYPVASALLAVGSDFGAVIALVVSWTLIGYGRAVAWEIPIMGTDFTLWRIIISLPVPALAGAFRRGAPGFKASLREGSMDFVNIVPRIALGVIGSGYIAAIIPQEVITGWLGPNSGWRWGGPPAGRGGGAAGGPG